MAGSDSKVAQCPKSPYTLTTAEEDARRLHRATAFVELVRHYCETTELHEQFTCPHVGPLRERNALPAGAYWPGEIAPRVITEALHSVYEDLDGVRASLLGSEHQRG